MIGHCLYAIVCGALLISSTACSHRWAIAPAEPVSTPVQQVSHVEPVAAPALPNPLRPDESVSHTPVERMTSDPVPVAGDLSEYQLDRAAIPVSDDGLPQSSTVQFVSTQPSSTQSPLCAMLCADAAEQSVVADQWADCDLPPPRRILCPRICEGLSRFRPKVCQDYRNFYCWPTGRDVLLGIAGGSLLANTSMDQDFRDWVQDDIRSDDTDNFAAFWKTFGEGNIFLPAFAGLGIAGYFLEDYPLCNAAGSFGARTTRAYLVGAPPMLFLQSALGGSRPGETSHESAWRPFEDNNGVSGHAFIGSVPFITAGNMCENPCIAGCFYFMSVLPAWSRINDDSHYLSQAALGWWLGYLACRSVDQTEAQWGCKRFTVAPLCTPDTAGVSAIYEF